LRLTSPSLGQGIYIGNNEMIDAPYTGVDVRVDTLNSYWQSVPLAIRSFG